ncbi:response regulator [bacterium (Candidatus Gribaldobacteria) CG_4_10_14_0_2_um_filter_33_15]|nr:MAG: response regulator [bacterium (Candidatus Gribaldobacteria) CG_4_10_14_0_2_um_filter_33_15]
MGKKILIAEDEAILSTLLEKKLIEEGYQIFVAEDGEKTMEILNKEEVDLLLLDIIMPKKSGFEVMEEMKKDSKLSKIPIIIISNSGQPVELSKIKELGAKDWLIKTEFAPQEVVEKVKKQIG